MKTAEDLKLSASQLVVRKNDKRLPKMKLVKASVELGAYIEDIRRCAEAVAGPLLDRHEGTMSKASSDRRKAALDMRLVIIQAK